MTCIAVVLLRSSFCGPRPLGIFCDHASARTLTVTMLDDVFVQAGVALDRNAGKTVAVTEEPAGGVPQPTGAMVVVGSAGSQ